MKDFICPIDERIIIKIEDDFKPVANCTTDQPNSECKMIQKGCIGCRFDKEAIFNANGDLRKLFNLIPFAPR